MSSLRRRPRSSAAKTPLEDDDLLSEILLRLPPQPSSLPRASLVCKRWRSLASDPGFFRRFRRHHRRSPPLLGFYNERGRFSFIRTLEDPNRVPLGCFSLQHGDGGSFLSLGCRHGLVLIFNTTSNQMLVWDPVIGDQHWLTIPPGIASHAEKTEIHGAVLLPAGEVDHFQVVVVVAVADNDDKQRRRALACVYSSQTGLWDLISTPLPSGIHGIRYLIDMPGRPTKVYTGKPAVLAGNTLYWMLTGNFTGVLEFDLEKQSLAVIEVPAHLLQMGQLQTVRAEGGALGLLLLTGSILQLWKRKTDCDGVDSWALERTIDLDKLLSLNSPSKTILGFAEENNVMFLWVCGVIFMVHLELLEFKKLFDTYIPCHHPFESVYPAGI
ncbi:unnamed protein product [Alopecurus aequalis]